MRSKIQANIQLWIAEGKMFVDDAAVLQVILSSDSITQKQIAERLPHLGSHAKDPLLTIDSTTRKVRSIVRRLRIKNKIPIIAGRRGYYVPVRDEDMKAYLNSMEREAKARAKSSIETYQAMREAAGVYSDYFERQLELFAI